MKSNFELLKLYSVPRSQVKILLLGVHPPSSLIIVRLARTVKREIFKSLQLGDFLFSDKWPSKMSIACFLLVQEGGLQQSSSHTRRSWLASRSRARSSCSAPTGRAIPSEFQAKTFKALKNKQTCKNYTNFSYNGSLHSTVSFL